MTIKTKRIYEPVDEIDGYRILVDRLWPRGIAKMKARVNLWFKEIAPSSELRQWFNHNEERWEEFREQYKAELKENESKLLLLRQIIESNHSATLLYAAADIKHNNAVVLKEALEKL